MQEELFDRFKKDIIELRIKNENNKKFMNLLSTEYVEKYFKENNLLLTDYSFPIFESDNEIVNSVLNQYISKENICETNGIYVYLSSGKVVVNRDANFKKKYKVYKACNYQNIEKNHQALVSFLSKENFERENTVIIPDNYISNIELTEEDRLIECKRIQLEFFKDALEIGQEEAKKKIIKKYVEPYL